MKNGQAKMETLSMPEVILCAAITISTLGLREKYMTEPRKTDAKTGTLKKIRTSVIRVAIAT